MAKASKAHLPLWERYLKIFRDVDLNDAQLGELVRAMMEYRFEGKEPQKLSDVVRILWATIHMDVDAALERYETAVEGGRKGGIKSASRKKQTQQPQEKVKADEGQARSDEVNQGQIKVKQGQARVVEVSQGQARSSKGMGTNTNTNTYTNTNTESYTNTQTNPYTNTPHQPFEVGGGGANVSMKKKNGEFGWVLLSQEEHEKLERRMGMHTLGQCIEYVDRCAQSNGNRNGWKDWYLVLLRCYEEGWYRPKKKTTKDHYGVPMGASGELGEAELEAIRQVLAKDI